MTETEKSFVDYCRDEIIPWLYRYVEVEKIHLNSMKTKLRNVEEMNSKWYYFFKTDTFFIKECIDHSEIVIKSAKKQIKQYQDYVFKNSTIKNG